MLELINILIGVASVISTWRFFLSVLIASLIALGAAHLVDSHIVRLVTIFALVITGVAFGVKWQVRFEKRRRNQ